MIPKNDTYQLLTDINDILYDLTDEGFGLYHSNSIIPVTMDNLISIHENGLKARKSNDFIFQFQILRKHFDKYIIDKLIIDTISRCDEIIHGYNIKCLKSLDLFNKPYVTNTENMSNYIGEESYFISIGINSLTL